MNDKKALHVVGKSFFSEELNNVNQAIFFKLLKQLYFRILILWIFGIYDEETDSIDFLFIIKVFFISKIVNTKLKMNHLKQFLRIDAVAPMSCFPCFQNPIYK